MPRVKEDERIEMIIRGLLKQSENRRCINCNSLGPQYVCTTFWTFICTNCSGVHREFTHRVKSVSMAKFKEDDIMSLQAGGNERARQIYFKAWDPQRNSYPDSSNLHKLREFIKHVYVDRKYAGANNRSMHNLDAKTQPNEWPSFEKSSYGSRAEFSTYARSSYEKSSPSKSNRDISFKSMMEEKSPRKGTNRSLSARFEIVDDRFRDDGIVKHYDRCLIQDSPRSQTNNAKKIPEIRPVNKDIVGDKFPPLKVGEPRKANDDKDDEGSARCQKVADVTNPGPTDEKQQQNKTVYLSSLIDFDANPEPAYSNNEKISSDPSPTNENAANMNSVESLLFELSAPTTPSSAQSNSFKATDVESTNEPRVSNSNGALAVITSQVEKNDLRPFTSVQQEHSLNAAESGDKSTPSGRKELPADLFGSNFTALTPAISGWHMSPSHGVGYNMQFHPLAMAIAAFPNSPAKSTNPFDMSLQEAIPSTQAATSVQSQPSIYSTALSYNVSPYGVNMPIVPGAYMGQQLNNTQLIRPQEIASSGSTQDAFAFINPIQQRGTDSPNAASNSSSRRNPFE